MALDRYLNTKRGTQQQQQQLQGESIISVIKGSKLLDDGSLIEMLKYRATQWFIEAFDSVSTSYPLNDILLSKAAHYHNVQVFQHLGKHTSMTLPESKDDLVVDILKCLSDTMLESYLAMTAHHPLPGYAGSHLAPVLGSGNIPLIRLLLRHVDRSNLNHSSLPDLDRGLNVDIIKVFLEELGPKTLKLDGFKMLGNILINSIKFNMIESAQYLIDHHPIQDTSVWWQKNVGLLEHCAVYGNVDIFKMLCDSKGGFTYLYQAQLDWLIFVGEANGRTKFISYIRSLMAAATDGDTQNKPMEQPNTSIANSSASKELVPLPRLRVTLMDKLAAINKAIVNDEVSRVTYLIEQYDVAIGLLPETCGVMSLDMIQLITAQWKPLLMVETYTLVNMINAMGALNNHITVDLVSQLISNCCFTKPSYMDDALEAAARVSSRLMRRISDSFFTRYTSRCLVKAMEALCIDTMAYIFTMLNQDLLEFPDESKDNDVVYKAVLKLISTGPLDTIALTLHNMPSLMKHPAKLCLAAVTNTLDVFEYLLDKCTPTLNHGHLQEILHEALIKDRQHVMDILYERHSDKNGTILQLNPNVYTLKMAAYCNAHHSLQYHFGTPIFYQMSKEYRLGVIHTVMDVAYANGHTSIIRHCSSLVQSIKVQNKKRKHPDPDNEEPSVALPTAPTDAPMDTAFHKVFRDKRLCRIITGLVGSIHDTLGIPTNVRIKGFELYSKDSLITYLNYGITESFIKSFSSVANYPLNNLLLFESICVCDTRSLALLQSYPQMTLDFPSWRDNDRDSLQLLKYLFSHLSSCTKPGWLQMLEEYLEYTCVPSGYAISNALFATIQHPVFLRELLRLGFKFELQDSLPRSHIASWIAKPYATDMITILVENYALTNDQRYQLLESALENNAQLSTVLQIISGPNFNLLSTQHRPRSGTDRRFTTPLLWCCNHRGGSGMESLEAIISLTPPQDIRVVEASLSAASLGLTAQYVRLCEINAKGRQRFNPLEHLPKALENGHLDIVNHILPYEQTLEYHRAIVINDIHHSILSVELLSRLLSFPQLRIQCGLAKVMGSAIISGNKAVIDILEQAGSSIKVDYNHALSVAAIVGDIDTAKMILYKHPDKCSMLKMDSHTLQWSKVYPEVGQLLCDANILISSNDTFDIIRSFGEAGSRMTESLAINLVNRGLANNHFDRGSFALLLKMAASKSLVLLKRLLFHLVASQDFFPGIYLDTAALRMAVTACASRGCTEGMERLIQLAIEQDPSTRVADILPAPGMIEDVVVLTYLLDKEHINMEEEDGASYARLTVDKACVNGDVGIVRLILQRCTSKERLQKYLPTIVSIGKASYQNRHQMIQYLFVDEVVEADGCASRWPAPFNYVGMEPIHLVRMLKEVRHEACERGHMKIIRLCDDMIKKQCKLDSSIVMTKASKS
ncbi:hypothetical protein SAMD00019534_076400 [Acytostelium subglobosum LB1]|uniref:hypothetical protein n=1 Tax=Acytostelium subglobosum LB1 TaxID=1410327 RepID=UPI0006451848|nr:hypothetical protein SAMD00019534_076400 [Acytostelium subglobosum LB1]GAM24465.1 hypothetical protein SAMD00019534_076400 [Acytostelium subglobosum LB1]|eukprot:XP_012752791.1 hypothetical protein SAMD00019534_076400 [Acytostelium subglobosum LB1]